MLLLRKSVSMVRCCCFILRQKASAPDLSRVSLSRISEALHRMSKFNFISSVVWRDNYEVVWKPHSPDTQVKQDTDSKTIVCAKGFFSDSIEVFPTISCLWFKVVFGGFIDFMTSTNHISHFYLGCWPITFGKTQEKVSLKQ